MEHGNDRLFVIGLLGLMNLSNLLSGVARCTFPVGKHEHYPALERQELRGQVNQLEN